jgi:cytochrome c-type biogenesis protein CcmH/NrfF
VLAEPPRSGFYLIAWIVPGVVVVAALAGGLLTLRAMRGRRADDDEHSAASDTDELQPYLAAVDRDLALDGRDNAEDA